MAAEAKVGSCRPAGLGIWAATEAGKGEVAGSPLEPPRRDTACGVSPEDLVQGSDLQIHGIINVCCFKPLAEAPLLGQPQETNTAVHIPMSLAGRRLRTL